MASRGHLSTGYDEELWNNQYNLVIRVDEGVAAPPGHWRMFRSKYTTASMQYAKAMTLARGRFLYEVHNTWDHGFVGYIVPYSIMCEAARYYDSDSLASWEKLPLHDRILHKNTYRSVLEQFPRMPEFVSKIVTERMLEQGRNLDRWHVEQNVVNHVRHEWTSYDFQLDCGHKKPDVLETIKPRLRDVLLQWMPADVAHSEVTAMWRRHKLLAEVKEESDSVPALLNTSLTYFAGAECPGNITTVNFS